MTKRAKVGRPKLPKGASRAELLLIRLTPAERQEVEAAAKRADESLSSWARRALLGALGAS
jgi:hypothetical protein